MNSKHQNNRSVSDSDSWQFVFLVLLVTSLLGVSSLIFFFPIIKSFLLLFILIGISNRFMDRNEGLITILVMLLSFFLNSNLGLLDMAMTMEHSQYEGIGIEGVIGYFIYLCLSVLVFCILGMFLPFFYYRFGDSFLKKFRNVSKNINDKKFHKFLIRFMIFLVIAPSILNIYNNFEIFLFNGVILFKYVLPIIFKCLLSLLIIFEILYLINNHCEKIDMFILGIPLGLSTCLLFGYSSYFKYESLIRDIYINYLFDVRYPIIFTFLSLTCFSVFSVFGLYRRANKSISGMVVDICLRISKKTAN